MRVWCIASMGDSSAIHGLIEQDGSMSALQPAIQSRILELREQRVMLGADLALLYGVFRPTSCSAKG
jgi:hypothetical protein